MFTVSLSGVRFTAPIGLYPQEDALRNELELHISVGSEALIGELPMIDYTILHSIAREAVREPAALLETVLQRIVERIGVSYPGTHVKVTVRKLHPPMSGIVDYSEVAWES